MAKAPPRWRGPGAQGATPAGPRLGGGRQAQGPCCARLRSSLAAACAAGSAVAAAQPSHSCSLASMPPRWIAELVVHWMSQHLAGLTSASPLGPEDEEAAQEELPPPMFPVRRGPVWAREGARSEEQRRGRRQALMIGHPSTHLATYARIARTRVCPALQRNWASPATACFLEDGIRDLVTANNGFDWVNEGTEEVRGWSRRRWLGMRGVGPGLGHAAGAHLLLPPPRCPHGF